uniref:uncharacterized protein LOC100187326 n=1 Tax=Ciona intestinalis TaxID=7719 RepID=UPI000EF46DCD|nr:uncharacterized protein LOC100187326 [Ciona intestinalis]|eukprot:XP_026696164.1 uncharacterized protein LOC100187326 [Ciona intestinalis]
MLGGVSCKVVDCGIPNINNIIPSHNYSYTSEVTIQCQHGYNIDPPGHASVVCDESGDWFPSPRHYRCIPVSCDLPRYIRHATVAGATTFNNTLIVTCDPGFHIRAGVNKVRSRCLADRTWDVNLNTIDCKSFTCKDPGYVTRSTRESLSAHLMHGAMYKFVCEHGYWVDGLYSIVVVCSLAGAWEPAVNFTCTEIRCLHPPMKVKSTLIINGGENRTDYAIDQTMRYECDDHSWLTVQYEVTEWTFTGLSDVTMTCKVTGQWYPHPDSFACRDITEGSVPVGYPRGLPGKKVFFGYWKRPLGGSNHTYSVAVSTGLLTWHGGPTMTSSIVKSQSASDIGYEVSKLWDGDAATSWRPVVTENRHYNVTIYLGGLYIVKGVEFSSNENEGSMVAALRLTFSDDGKSFNRSLELSMREGRSNNRPISIENQPGRLRFSGFEDVAKFVQITILSTMDGSAPTIGEVRFLSMTSQWSIVIPIDDITIPVILSCTLVCMFIMMVWAVRRDANDRGAIHFVMNEVTMDTDIVMIQIKLVQSRPPVQFLCRLLGEDTTSFIVEHRVATNTMLVVVPVQRFQGLRFQLCIVPGESPAIDVSIKIGMLSIDDVIEGNVSWLFVKQSRLSPGVPQSYKFDKVGESVESQWRGLNHLDESANIFTQFCRIIFCIQRLLMTFFVK